MNKKTLKTTWFRLNLKLLVMLLKFAKRMDVLSVVEPLRRPEWIYRCAYPSFQHHHFLSSPKPITDDDIRIAERLIVAWHKAGGSHENVKGLWDTQFQGDIAELFAPLQNNDARRLATVLANMFHSGFIQGMAHGWRHRRWAKSALLVPYMIEDKLVSLAEAVGAVRTETYEQGVCGYAVKDGLDALVQKVEEVLAISLAFPEVGAPSGILAASGLLTLRQMEHIYTAYRINQGLMLHIPTVDQPSCIEIGGGYGGLALWFLRLRKLRVKSYTLVDLAWVNVIQGYFLAKVFGMEQVKLYNERETGVKPLISILPSQAINHSDLWEHQVDVVINQDSMPEMPVEVVENYLRWIKMIMQGVFYSYQHEAASVFEATPQVYVREVVDRIGGFQCLSRDYSWLRRGYTEEFYRLQKSVLERR
jgi:putative sugar O-methyltransferase